MLHTEFLGNRPARSGEEDFEGFLPYMGMVATLVMWLTSHIIFFNFHVSLHIKFD